jgi:putative ABC transport system permease protein
MRLAIRDARGNRGRSLLVVALVALPVALVVGAYLFGTSRTWGDLQMPRESLGRVAAGSAEPVGAEMGRLGAQGWADTLPSEWRLVPWPAVAADLGGPMGGQGVGGAAGDFADPIVGGQVDLTAGRVPSSADEVVITPGLARSAGLEVGDPWTASMWNWTGFGENRAVPLTVVGIGDVAGAGSGPSFVVGGVPPGWGTGSSGSERFLIDTPTPITADQVAAAAQQAVHVVGRDVPIEDPDRLSLTLTDELVVGLAVAFVQIVMLAGAAFAVSLRRRQRELALLSAAGAEPGDLTRAVLASGILLGGIGALLGVALPWLVLVAGRPLLEWQFGWALAPVPPMERAIVLVPIVGLLAAVAASVVPARVAARIPLATALRARDSATVGLDPAGRGRDRLPIRSALAGVALIVAGVLFLVVYPTGAEEGLGSGGWPIWALGPAVVVCEVGVVLLAPLVLALVAGHSRALPLSARLASRDASRNRLRSSFAVAAVAVSVGLLAGSLTWLSSVNTAVRDAYRPSAAPGTLVLARSTDQARWGPLDSDDLSSVASELPGAQVALIGVGPTWDVRAGDSLAIRSQCDPLTEFGVAGQALGIMDPAQRASLAVGLADGDPCRAPVPAGGPLGPVSVIGGMAGEQRPGLVVADADAAALLIGRDDPVVRAQLESGGAVALAPSSVVDGSVRIAADPRLVGGEAGPGEWVPGPQVDVPAIVVDSPFAPAAVIVAPQALESRGLPAPSNAVVVLPTSPQPGFQPLSDQLVSHAGLQVMSVETGPPRSSLVRSSSGEPLALGPWDLGWGLIVLPLAFALLATVLVTGLALGDARPELATMAAVGAAPRVRRRFAMWAAVIVSGVGCLLGALAGIAPAWAAVRSLDVIMDPAACLWSPVHPMAGPSAWAPQGMVHCDVPLAIGLQVPWGLLGMVVVGLPLVAGLLFLVVPRARVPLPRR